MHRPAAPVLLALEGVLYRRRRLSGGADRGQLHRGVRRAREAVEDYTLVLAGASDLLQPLGADAFSASGVELDGTLAATGSDGRVGGESRRQIVVGCALTEMTLPDLSARFRMQRFVDMLAAEREARALAYAAFNNCASRTGRVLITLLMAALRLRTAVEICEVTDVTQAKAGSTLRRRILPLCAVLLLAAPAVGVAADANDLLRLLEPAAQGPDRAAQPEERAATRARLDAVTGEPGDVLRALEAEAAAARRDRPREWAAAEARLDAALAQQSSSPFRRRPGTPPPDPSVGGEPWPLPLMAERAIGAETARLRRALLRGIAGNPDPRRLPLLEALRQGMPPDALDDALPQPGLWDELLCASATLAWTEARLPGLLAAEGPPRYDDLGLGLVLRFAPELQPEARRLAFDRLLVRRSDPETMWRQQVEDRYWKALLLLDRARSSDVMAAGLGQGPREASAILGVLENEPGVGESLARALRGLRGRLTGRDRDLLWPMAQVALLRMAPRENLQAALDEAMAIASRAREDETGDEAMGGVMRIVFAARAIDATATAARVAPLLRRRDIDAPSGLSLLDGLEAGRDPNLAQRIREWRSAGPRRSAMLAERARVWGPYGRRALREAGR